MSRILAPLKSTRGGKRTVACTDTDKSKRSLGMHFPSARRVSRQIYGRFAVPPVQDSHFPQREMKGLVRSRRVLYAPFHPACMRWWPLACGTAITATSAVRRAACGLPKSLFTSMSRWGGLSFIYYLFEHEKHEESGKALVREGKRKASSPNPGGSLSRNRSFTPHRATPHRVTRFPSQ